MRISVDRDACGFPLARMTTIQVRPDPRGGWSVLEGEAFRPWLPGRDRDAAELLALHRARGRAVDVQLFSADGRLEHVVELRPVRAATLGTCAPPPLPTALRLTAERASYHDEE